jgi:hypothetical protein
MIRKPDLSNLYRGQEESIRRSNTAGRLRFSATVYTFKKQRVLTNRMAILATRAWLQSLRIRVAARPRWVVGHSESA